MTTFVRSKHRWSCGKPKVHIATDIDHVGGTAWTLCGELRWPDVVTGDDYDQSDLCRKCTGAT